MAPRNLGEFAFTTCVFGVLFLIPATFLSVVAVTLLRDRFWSDRLGDWDMLAALLAFWGAFQFPLYRALLRKAAHWPRTDVHARQLFYSEICSLLVGVVFQMLAVWDPYAGYADVARGLKYLFSGLMVLLVGYHATACFFLKIRPPKAEAIVWLGALAAAIAAFRDIEF